jgi:hypothetical protein
MYMQVHLGMKTRMVMPKELMTRSIASLKNCCDHGKWVSFRITIARWLQELGKEETDYRHCSSMPTVNVQQKKCNKRTLILHQCRFTSAR